MYWFPLKCEVSCMPPSAPLFCRPRQSTILPRHPLCNQQLLRPQRLSHQRQRPSSRQLLLPPLQQPTPIWGTRLPPPPQRCLPHPQSTPSTTLTLWTNAWSRCAAEHWADAIVRLIEPASVTLVASHFYRCLSLLSLSRPLALTPL